MTLGKIDTTKDLTGKFIVKEVDLDTVYFVETDLGNNQYEMIDVKSRIAYCIDVDCNEVLEVLKFRN